MAEQIHVERDTHSGSKLQANNNSRSGWYSEARKKLESKVNIEEFMTELKQCATDTDRVRKIYSVTGVCEVSDISPSVCSKSAEDSVELRNQGNKVFQKRYNQKALDLYNASIRMAPMQDDTAGLALALANRSAVLLHMKHYDLALLDITAALKYGYPDHLRYKLLERRGRCYYQLRCKELAKQSFEEAKLSLKDAGLEQEKRKNLINEYDKQVWQCSKMSGSSMVPQRKQSEKFHGSIPKVAKKNPVMPCVSEAVAMVFSPNSGRGLVAARDIDVGESLIVEQPYSSTLLPEHGLVYCHHCCNRVISHVSCPTCSDVVFCSEICKMKALEEYHHLECDILSTVRMADISLGHLALRIVMRAGFLALKEFPADFVPSSEKEVLSVGLDESGLYNSNDYRTVYHLVKHTDLRSPENLLRKILEAVFLLKCLEKTKFFDGADRDDNGEVSLADRCRIGGDILRHIQMLPCNAHEVSELTLTGTNMAESVTVEIGSAIYPVLSLINHSCDPSVVRHSYGDHCVVRAIRGIPKGTEILDNYGALYPLTKCPERREKLAMQYYFTCNCLACIDDYPLYFDTPSDAPVFKCEKCGGPVFLPMEGKSVLSNCSSCKHPQNVTKKMGVLAKSDEMYRNAIQQVLTDRSGNLDSFLPTLVTHLKLMDRFLCRPWRDYNDCQEAIKQCYSVQANCFNVTS